MKTDFIQTAKFIRLVIRLVISLRYWPNKFHPANENGLKWIKMYVFRFSEIRIYEC